MDSANVSKLPTCDHNATDSKSYLNTLEFLANPSEQLSLSLDLSLDLGLDLDLNLDLLTEARNRRKPFTVGI